MPFPIRVSLLLLTGLGVVCAHAQADADRAAIQKIVQTEQDTWNRGDWKAFSADFAEDGSFTNIYGMQTYGRGPFEKQHQFIFTTIYKGSHNVFTLGRLRFVRPDVAVADVDSTLSEVKAFPPGTPLDADGAIHTKLQLVLSRENGKWQIDAFHNVVFNPAFSRPSR